MKLEKQLDVDNLMKFLKYCSPDMPEQPTDCEYLFTCRCPRYVTCNVVRKAEAYEGFARKIELPRVFVTSFQSQREFERFGGQV